MILILKNSHKILLLIICLFIYSSCNSNQIMDNNNNNPTPSETTTIILTSGTMGDLDGKRVGCANIVEQTYTLPSGEETEGLTAGLSLSSGNWITVGAGSEFEVDGTTWKVLKVEGEDVHLTSVEKE